MGRGIIPTLRDLFFASFVFLVICAYVHLKKEILGDAVSFSQDCVY